DNETVATLDVSADTQTCTVVAGQPGSAVVTLTDGTISATLAVDVVPGSVATVEVTTGDPVPQTPASDTGTPSAKHRLWPVPRDGPDLSLHSILIVIVRH